MNLAKAVLIGMSFIPLIGWAQKNEIWADLTLYKNLSSKITLFGDAGPRINVDGNSTAGFYLRPSVSFLVSKKMMVGGGVAWFYAHSKEGVINEVRGWQGIRIEQRILNRVLMSNFTRLEERNFFLMDSMSFCCASALCLERPCCLIKPPFRKEPGIFRWRLKYLKISMIMKPCFLTGVGFIRGLVMPLAIKRGWNYFILLMSHGLIRKLILKR